MSGWLHNLVLRARGGDRTVRPLPIGYRSVAFSPDVAAPSLTSEVSPAVAAAETSAQAPGAPAMHVQWGRDRQGEHQRHETNGHSPDVERAAATQREHDARGRDDSGVLPARDPARPESSASNDPFDYDARGWSGRETPAADGARHVQMLPDAPPRRTESTASLIRPAMLPRAAAPAREAADFGRPAPVPDVHIHIGRIELTAVTAPAPRRERAAAPNNSMSLDEYLRRRNRGGR